MKLFATALFFLASANSFAASRSIALNEVPEAITKNLGNICSATVLSHPTTVLDVKSKNVDAVYAVPCQLEGQVITSAVYVMLTNGKFDYLNFHRGSYWSYYIPTPALSLEGESVKISFSSVSDHCSKGEQAEYAIVDNSNFFMYNFQAEVKTHSCNN